MQGDRAPLRLHFSLTICTTCGVTPGHNPSPSVVALTGWLFHVLFCSAGFSMTILATGSVQEPYAHHFPLSSFSHHHPQTFLCSCFPFFLLSPKSLDVFKFYFPEISPAGLWHIAALTSLSTPAPVALSQSSPAAFSLLQAAVSRHSSEGWAITPADEMLVSSRHKASPTPPCHLCRWDIAGAFQSCRQLNTGSLCPLQLATRLLCLPSPLPA